MVKIIKGDLLQTDCEIIVHQVNCQGVMGSGVAKQIKAKYPKVFEIYKQVCDTTNPLGKLLRVPTNDDKTQWIYNLFTQDKYGRDKCHTDYEALQNCFNEISEFNKPNRRIAMPYKIGCGLGGGDWDRVYKMIKDTFTDYEVILYKL